MSIHCTTPIGKEPIGLGWRRGVSDIVEDPMVRWNELDSSGFVRADGKACCDYPAAEDPSGLVLWCFCQQREVSQRDTAEVSKTTRETEVEKAKQEGW